MASDGRQHWMGFNIFAFVRPQNPKEYGALLDEALRELKNLSENINATFEACQKERDEKEYLLLMPADPMPLSFWTHGIRPGGKPLSSGALDGDT